VNTSWGDTGHLVWNACAWAVILIAAAALASPRSRGLRRGWPSKVLWVLSVGFGFSISGFYIPLGAIGALWQITRGWRELESAQAEIA
jgi:hypothetical protein